MLIGMLLSLLMHAVLYESQLARLDLALDSLAPGFVSAATDSTVAPTS